MNTLLRPGKLHELIKSLNKHKIQILAPEDTRLTDENILDFSNYYFFLSKNQ